jgi:pyridoxamine 5'-phosphate oxidase
MAGALKEQLRDLKVLSGPFASFDVDAAPGEPASLFRTWLQSAIDAGVREPHAMTLSTVDADGFPDARVLILKNVDEHGWHFAITRTSPKGRQIAARAHVALTFYWQPLGRQVRIRGLASDMGSETSAADFLARPQGSRAGALLARQSDVLEDDAEVEAGLRQQLERIQREPNVVAPGWTVYAVDATAVEFWQGHEARRHTRLRYVRTSRAWSRERLWP